MNRALHLQLLLTVGVGGGEHGALGDGAPEHDGGGADALPVGAVPGFPAVERPEADGHHYPLLLGLRRHLLARGPHRLAGAPPPAPAPSRAKSSVKASPFRLYNTSLTDNPPVLRDQAAMAFARPESDAPPRPEENGKFRTRAVGAPAAESGVPAGAGRRSGERPHGPQPQQQGQIAR